MATVRIRVEVRVRVQGRVEGLIPPTISISVYNTVLGANNADSCLPTRAQKGSADSESKGRENDQLFGSVLDEKEEARVIFWIVK